jgi:hypothetical protein
VWPALETFCGRRGLEIELLVERGAGQQRRRRGAKGLRHRTHSDLVQVHVVQPHFLAIGDDLLLERLGVGKAKTVRAHEFELTRRGLFLCAIG